MGAVDRQTVEEYGMPSLLLMESAANACLRAIAARFPEGLTRKRACVLCGPGNNGGDGAALARALAREGVHADVVLFATGGSKGDAEINFNIARAMASFRAGSGTTPTPLTFHECNSVGEWEEIARPRDSYDLVVDALFGTGLSRPLAGVYLQVIEHLDLLRRARERGSTAKPLIISIDIPSGLNADSAEPIGPAVQADLTVTFTAPKPANVLPPACHQCGDLIVANIGSPTVLVNGTASATFLTDAPDARDWLLRTRYAPESHKNTHGHAVIIAGSRNYSGAPVLCANAAMRSGAGLVTLAVPTSAQLAVAARAMPEVIVRALPDTKDGALSEEGVDLALDLISHAHAAALGPGLSADDESTRRFVRIVAERCPIPLVLDADGLNCLAPWPSHIRGSSDRPLILTPHPGEMRRLLGTTEKIAGHQIEVAREFAKEHQVILILKGSRSIIAAPNGRVFVNPTGNAGVGTAGSGDTLTGVVTGFNAQTYGTIGESGDPLATTIAALYVSGVAADLAAQKWGMRTMVASDIAGHLSDAIRILDAQGESPNRNRS
jgi:ADP-dependent NAD(P)H-hydrate dehydratase / NAD(P)H-hydrate epimerase